MTHINIFKAGEFSDSEAGIRIRGKNNKADIEFTDDKGRKSSASLRVYSRSQLFRKDICKNAVPEKKSEIFVSEWITRRHHHAIVRYAGKEQQAFVFEMEDRLGDEAQYFFDRLMKSEMIPTLDYFREIRFCRILDRCFNHITVADLKKQHRMNDARILLLSRYCDLLPVILSLGISPGAMNNLTPELLAFLDTHCDTAAAMHRLGLTLSILNNLDGKKLEWTGKNAGAIIFLLENKVKPEQILKYSRVKKSSSQFVPAEEKEDGEFTLAHDKHHLTVCHHPTDSKLHVRIERYREKFKLEDRSPDYKQVSLIHQWYLSADSGAYWCPDLSLVMRERVSGNFPREKFCSDACATVLRSLPFYGEYHFVLNLEKRNCSVGTFRLQPGMNQKKLEKLFWHADALYCLIDSGLALNDVAGAEEQRLYAVLTDFDRAKAALDFMTPAELLGIQDMRASASEQKYSLIEYSQAAGTLFQPLCERMGRRSEVVLEEIVDEKSGEIPREKVPHVVPDGEPVSSGSGWKKYFCMS